VGMDHVEAAAVSVNAVELMKVIAMHHDIRKAMTV
jgi:hypothetical protein